MQINIKATNLDLTPAIREYIEAKIGSVSKFLKGFEVKNETEIFIEIARTSRHHKSGNVFYAEATLALGKKVLRAEHSDWDIRVAIDKMKDKIQEEIKRYKEKMTEGHQTNGI